MIQLSYQAAFDPYNTAFRLLRLRECCWTHSSVSFEALRIADFFLLFPVLIANKGVRLQRKHAKYRKLSTKYASLTPFAQLPAMDTLFRRMEPFHIAAAETLVTSGLALPAAWGEGFMHGTGHQIPQNLMQRIADVNETQDDLLEFLTALVTEYEVSGVNGLKDRTSLLEFRYDTV